MSSFRRHFPYYRVSADGCLTHCAASDAGNLPFHWAEIDPARKPEPTDAQLDSLHCEADLFGEPQIKENIRDALEGFRDIWLSYWALPLPTPFDPSFEAETNLNPLTQSLAKRFANDIVSYPRLLLPSGFVQLGGVQFVGPLRPPKDRPYTTRTAPADEANRGAIDLAISLFKEHIRNVGQRCACTCEAIEVMGRFDTLIAWLEDANGFDDSAIANLIDLPNLLDDAQSFAALLADRKRRFAASLDYTKPVKRLGFLAGFRLYFKSRVKLKGLSDDAIHAHIRKSLNDPKSENNDDQKPRGGYAIKCANVTRYVGAD